MRQVALAELPTVPGHHVAVRWSVGPFFLERACTEVLSALLATGDANYADQLFKFRETFGYTESISERIADAARRVAKIAGQFGPSCTLAAAATAILLLGLRLSSRPYLCWRAQRP